MVREGEIHKIDNVIFKIVEVIPIRDLTGNEEYLIGYRIIDSGFVSPIAHFWIRKNEDIREKIRQIVEYYKQTAHCVYPESLEITFEKIRKDVNDLKKSIDKIMKMLEEKERKKKS